MIFMLFSNILGNGNFCSEIEAWRQGKEEKTFLKKANMPNNATIEPNRVADIVRGGGLKPGKLKKCELLSLLKAVAWIAPS